MTNRKTWKEFGESGLLWWINMILHTFGWAIVVCVDDYGEVEDVFPARVDCRGFEEEDNTSGYAMVSKYMMDNAKDLYEESLGKQTHTEKSEEKNE